MVPAPGGLSGVLRPGGRDHSSPKAETPSPFCGILKVLEPWKGRVHLLGPLSQNCKQPRESKNEGLSGLKGPSIFRLKGVRQALHLSFSLPKEGREEKKKEGPWSLGTRAGEHQGQQRVGDAVGAPCHSPHPTCSCGVRRPCALAASSLKCWARLLICPPQGFFGGPALLLGLPIDTAQRCEGINAPWGKAHPLGEWGLADKCPSLPSFGRMSLRRKQRSATIEPQLSIAATGYFPVCLIPASCDYLPNK